MNVPRWVLRFWKWNCWVTEFVHSVDSAKLPSTEDVRIHSPADKAPGCLSPHLPAQCFVEPSIFAHLLGGKWGSGVVFI